MLVPSLCIRRPRILQPCRKRIRSMGAPCCRGSSCLCSTCLRSWIGMGKHSVAASREDCHNTLIWVRGNDVVTDYSAMFISGETFEKFMKSLTSVGQALPPEMRKSLFDVQDIYIVKY